MKGPAGEEREEMEEGCESHDDKRKCYLNKSEKAWHSALYLHAGHVGAQVPAYSGGMTALAKVSMELERTCTFVLVQA